MPWTGLPDPGLLTPWLENDDAASALLAEYSGYAGTDLVTHGTTSDEETIRDTAIAQPLIVASSLLSARALGLTPDRLTELGDKVLVSGHSVGEIPAATLAGALTAQQALELIAVRATAMAEAAAAESTGMAAVLGGAEEDVLAAIESAGLTPANINGAGQIVAAGSQSGVDYLCSNPRHAPGPSPESCRGIPHPVHGAR